MAKPRPAQNDPLSLINFVCRTCQQSFKAAPGRIEDAPEREWHPYIYFSPCPEECGNECEQAHWEKGLMATAGKKTGPTTSEGKAKVTQNLEGHPTPEEALRTRFNALKHGIFARVARHFPSRPGKYPHCDNCEHFNNGCGEQIACLKRTELYMRHDIAFETQDPGMLMNLNADLQAAVRAIIDDILLAVVSTGVQIKSPQWYYDKDGGFHLAKYKDSEGEQRIIYEISAHPLLKTLSDFLSKNNLSMGDLMMTPKTQDDHDLMKGHLEDNHRERESAESFRQRIEVQQNTLLQLMTEGHTNPEERVIEGEVEIG